MSDKISFLLRILVFSSHVSHILFISVTSSRYMTDFIRPFYSCMLNTLVLECTESRMWVPLFPEPSVSLMCIWTLFTFEKKWSCTSAQGQSTLAPNCKTTIKSFYKKRLYILLYWTHSISSQNLIYVSRI